MAKSLGILVQKVYDQLNYNPKLKRYRDHVVELLNEHYLRVCTEAPWRFLQRTFDLTLYGDISGSATSLMAITAPRQLVSSGAAAITFGDHMEGMVFHGFKGDPINAADDTFRIAGVESSTVAYLDKNWPYATGAAQYWAIEFREYILPPDVSEILGIVDRDDERGRLFALSRTREEQEFLNRSSKGDPIFWFEADTFYSRSPDEGPALGQSPTTTGSGTGLTAGRTYAYMYTFYRNGRESNPSPIVQIKLSGTNSAVNLSALEDTRCAASSGATLTSRAGIVKRIYRRDVTADGPWLHIASKQDFQTTHTDAELVNTSLYRSREQVTVHQNAEGRKTIKFWWTPDETKNLDIRYMHRPTRLQGKSDSTVLPEGYDDILINYAMNDILSRVGDKTGSQMHYARAEDGMQRLRNKELNLPDRGHRFRRLDQGYRNDILRNYGSPTIT